MVVDAFGKVNDGLAFDLLMIMVGLSRSAVIIPRFKNQAVDEKTENKKQDRRTNYAYVVNDMNLRNSECAGILQRFFQFGRRNHHDKIVNQTENKNAQHIRNEIASQTLNPIVDTGTEGYMTVVKKGK